MPVATEPGSTEDRLRQVLWAVALAVYVGAAVELLLVEHWVEWQQWIALATVVVALVTGVRAWRAPSATTLRVARVVSVAVLAVSVLGVGFHLWGNFEFSREVTPGDGLWERAWDTVSGGSPAFAPGMLAVAAVLTLAASWNPPAGPAPPSEGRRRPR